MGRVFTGYQHLRFKTSIATLGKDTIRKKIVKRILSPITILRSVSEEEKNVVDLPQTENESSAYQTKSSESLSQRRPKKLLDMNPYHLAQELTLIDKELLIRIPWNELSTCGWMTKDKVSHKLIIINTHRTLCKNYSVKVK